jgi:hypothetical protein
MNEPQASDGMVREVFASFGLAIYQTNVLEQALHVHIATLWSPSAKRRTPEQYDRELTRLEGLTLGALVSEARQRGVRPDWLVDFQEVVETRNWLAHRYFAERAATFIYESGCVSMVAELRAIADRTREIHSRLSADLAQSGGPTWRERVGTEQARMLEEEQERLAGSAD